MALSSDEIYAKRRELLAEIERLRGSEEPWKHLQADVDELDRAARAALAAPAPEVSEPDA